MCISSSPHCPWKQLGVKLLIVFTLSTLGTDNSYGMAIAAQESNIEKLITNTSGLTPQEETLLVDTIEGIISKTKKTWYPNSFSPSEDNSYSDASDGQRVVQLQSLANTGMEVIDKIDKRLKELEEKKREKLGRWGFLEDMDDTPYRISTNSHDLVFEIEKYNCLKNKGTFLPSNPSKDVSGSLWMQYTDSVYVPFNCPKIPDFDREQAAKEHQRLMARLSRTKRASDDQTTIVQVNLTITNKTFQKTLYNQTSNDYMDITRGLTFEIDKIFNVTGNYKGVTDFSYRPGSVIATFHIETTESKPVLFVKTKLIAGIIGIGTFGSFMVDKDLLKVGEFKFENAHYYQWGEWGQCSKSCGTGSQSRSRSCNSTVPLACAHEGPAVETQECYIEYCSNECTREFTGERGNFTSPVVYGLYPINADCVWTIKVDDNHTVVVQFEEFNLEKDKKCKYDYVAFYDGVVSPGDYDRKELLRFCGNSTPPHSHPAFGYPINSSSSSITVRFKTDSTKQRLGFTAIWHQVLKYHLRISNVKPQYVTAMSFIYNPWSMMKSAAIPLGKATTCPKSWSDDRCYFPGKHNVISRIISVFLSRKIEITSSDPVVIKFEHILDETMFPEAYMGRKTCVTWDNNIKSPQPGAWTKRECLTSFSNLTHTVCKCLHTGMFAVLGDMKPPPKDLHIKANIYLCCAVFLILVIATIHSLATKEKKTTGELFHLFEAIGSGFLLVIFLIGAHVPAEKELCGFLAFFLYYLVLSQFTWMLLTVLWMQNFLKRLLSENVRLRTIYFVLGWGVPIVLAGVAGKIDIDKNGHEDNVCWVSISGVGTVWGYGAPVFAMFIVNVIILVYLLLPMAKAKFCHDKLRPRIVKEFFVMLSFIITGCLAVKVTLDDKFSNQYFFCIFLTLQGALNYNVCHESTELFWRKEEVKTEGEGVKEETNETTEKVKTEETEQKEKENQQQQQPRMTVKTLKNLNIYKENGVFVIEA